MANILHSSIVRIQAANGTISGAGFLVTGRHLLTCAHVVCDALGQPASATPTELVHLDFPLIANSQPLTARVVIWRPKQPNGEGDIAGLELSSPPPDGACPIRLVAANNMWGHACRAFGFPATHDNGVWASGVLRDRKANGRIQIEDTKIPGYAIQPGFSGTPVWDDELGGVVGMIVTASGNKERRANIKAAFIIPTDKLIEALPESLSSQLLVGSGIEASYRTYLQKEHNHLKMSGIPIDVQADIPLTKIYIKLRVLPEVSPRQKSDLNSIVTNGESEVIRYLGEQQWQRQEESNDSSNMPVDPVKVVEEHRAVMIWGKPGAGKSTLLRYLTHKYAANPESLLPLFVPLKKLPAFLQKTPAFMDALLELLTEHTSGEKREKLKATLTTAIAAQRVRFLFDGLDEVQNSSIDENLTSLASDGHYVVVTSRPFGKISIGGYQHVEVDSLSLKHAKEFVQNWFNILASAKSIPKPKQRTWIKEQTEWLYKQLDRQPTLQKVARNPLMLTFLAVLAGDNPRRALPRSRADLYQQYVENLVTSWERSRHQQKQLMVGDIKGGKAKKLSLWALYQIAWLLHQAHYGENTSRFPARKQIESHLTQKLTQRGMGWLEAESLPAEILNFWIQAGLLDKHDVRAKEWLLFRHQMFQEYGAARTLETLPEDERWQILASRLHQPQWQEVVLLTAASLPDASDFIRRILNGGQTNPLEPHLHKHLFLAARCLSEGATVKRELLAQVVNELEKHLLSDMPSLWNQATELLSDIGPANCHDLVLQIAQRHISNPNLEACESAIYLMIQLGHQNEISFQTCVDYINKVIVSEPRRARMLIFDLREWIKDTANSRRQGILVTIVDLLCNHYTAYESVPETLVKLGKYKHVSFIVVKTVVNKLSALERPDLVQEVDSTMLLSDATRQKRLELFAKRDQRLLYIFADLLDPTNSAGKVDKKLKELKLFCHFIKILDWPNTWGNDLAFGRTGKYGAQVFQVVADLLNIEACDLAAQAKYVADKILPQQPSWLFSEDIGSEESLPSIVHPLSDKQIDILICAWSDTAEWVRHLATIALAHSFDNRVLHALNQALEHNSNPRVRQLATHLLGVLDQRDERTLQNLMAALRHDTSWEVRQEAAEALGRKAYQQTKVVEVLIQAITDPERQVCIAAVKSLSGIKPTQDRVIHALIQAYKPKNPARFCSKCEIYLTPEQSSCAKCDIVIHTIRETIIETLGQIAEPATNVMEIITRALHDSNHSIRQAAGKAVAQLWLKEPEEVSQHLIATVRAFSTADKDLSGLTQAIAQIPRQPQAQAVANRDMSLLGEWLSLAKHPSRSIRQATIAYLSTVYSGHPQVISALVESLDDEEVSVREAAFKALHKQPAFCKMGR